MSARLPQYANQRDANLGPATNRLPRTMSEGAMREPFVSKWQFSSQVTFPEVVKVLVNSARGGNRTRTVLSDPGGLSPLRLPITPPGLSAQRVPARTAPRSGRRMHLGLDRRQQTPPHPQVMLRPDRIDHDHSFDNVSHDIAERPAPEPY